MPEEHGVQQQTQRGTQNQHLHHQMALHPSQTSLLQGYGARSRSGGGGKALQGNTSSGSIHMSDSPYRKEVMDYYMSVSGKERTRRGSQALEYGAGFGYSSVGGQVPHQYRHAANGPDASMLSDYQLDYVATASGNGGNTNTGKNSTGNFSPAHQYGLSQTSSLQSRSGHQIHPQQQTHDYPSRQTFPQRQQHRGYSVPGHRQLPPFSQYPMASASTGSAGIYNFAPQRYHSSSNSTNFECENSNAVGASSKAGSEHSSLKSNNMVQLESGRLSYSTNYPPYNFHGSQSFHKQSLYPPRYSQHNLRPEYDISSKLQTSSLPSTPSASYSKHSQPSISSSDSLNTPLPQFPSQEVLKPVTQPQTQQPPASQNFSPISNPSPVASGVQSPNCSSSPSPLTGVSEGSAHTAVHSNQHSSHTSVSEHQNSQQLQLVHQLSPTPNSNSSISSFESSIGNVNTLAINPNPGGNHSVLTQGQMGSGRTCDKNFSSVYPSSVDKLTRDPAINSLNALTSQVANLPSTVQHMLVSESLFSKNGGKDATYQPDDHYQTLQTSHGLATSQQRIKGNSNGCNSNVVIVGAMDSSAQSDSRMNENSKVVKQEVDEQPLEGRSSRTRQLSGASSESDTTSYHILSKNQVKQAGNGSHGLPFEVKVAASKSQNQTLTCSRRTEHHNPSVSPPSSPSSLPPSVESIPTIPSSQTAASFISTSISNSPVIIPAFQSPKEFCVTNINERNSVKCMEKDGMYDRKNKRVVNNNTEGMLEECKCDLPARENQQLESHDRGTDAVLLNTSPRLNKKVEERDNSAKPQSSEISSEILKIGEAHNVGVGVIVSARSEMPQPGVLSESPKDTSSAVQHLHNELQRSQNNPNKTHVCDVFKDSGCLNGQSGSSPCNFTSVNGNIVRKPSYEQALLSHHHSENHKSPYGYSEPAEGKGMDLKKAESAESNTADEAKLQYQSHHQLPLGYLPRHRKIIGSTGIVRLGRKGRERGHDNQVQHSSPSLLQEVLQGYHVDKTYEHSKNQQLPDTHLQSPNVGHHTSKHSYSVTASTKPHNLVPKTEVSGDSQVSAKAVAPVKDYPINLKMGNTNVVGQDPCFQSWAPVGVGRVLCEPSQKTKMETSPNNPTSNLQETNESCQHPLPKSTHFSVYTSPHRKTVQNPRAESSAMQQLLLEDTEPKIASELFVNQINLQASSSLPSSISSSERCSVICDVSVRTTSEREKDRDKNKEQGHCKQTSSTGASVIQQSHSSPLTNLERNSKENIREIQIKTEASSPKKTINQSDNCGFYPRHLPDKKNAVQLQNRPAYQSGSSNSDTHVLSPGDIRNVHLGSVNPYHAQSLSSSVNPQSSPSSRCQSNFTGIEGSGGCPGYGFENLGEGRTFHLHGLSQQHPHLSTKFQIGKSQATNKLQTYTHSQSVQYSCDIGDKHEWAALNKNKHSKEIIMTSNPGSGGHQYRNPAGMRSQTSHTDTVMQPKLSQQLFSQQGNYYNMKLWSVSEPGKDAGGTFESNTYQTNQSGAINPGSGPSRGVTEKGMKSFQPISSQFNSSGNNSCAGGMVNVGTLQGQRQVKTEHPGDANPLMMRRRVRSFISPIPAKRQHQDISQQQQQRNAPSLCPSNLQNTPSRHPDANSASPDTLSSKLGILDSNYSKISKNMTSTSPSPSEGKTKILPPRKGRGLKLEAIVQKITPNLEKGVSNRSHADSVPNPLTGLTHTDVIHYNLDSQEQDSSVGGNLSKIAAGHGSSHPYLDEGLSLEEIMSFKGVEEIGPLAPTAYPCDINQNPMTIKCGTPEDMNRNVIEDFKQEIHYGMEAEAPQFTERDCATGNKEELRLPSDFTLLGPLPPPPPLPRPVEASPPPSSSVLSDIQHFTNTYQQLETRRGEDSAEDFLRKKLTDTGMVLGSDDYASRDFYGTNSFNHNQNSRHCLLTRHPNNHQIHQQHPFPQALSSMTNASQLTELKPLESVVPKGYFPSGKKKGRPVGSVNKQKRAQVQTQNVCVTLSPVLTTQTNVLSVTTEMIPSSASTNAISAAPSLTDEQPSSEVSFDASQIINMDTEKEDAQPKAEAEQGEIKEEESEGTKIENRQRKRRRRVGALMGKDALRVAAETDQKSASEVFLGHRKSVFAPYVHVERKAEEIGAVCTIVNEEDEKKGEGKTDVLSNSTISFELTKKERNAEILKEKPKMEAVSSNLLLICTAGKTVPLSGYVISGPVITESSHSGHLLCCLCKKWANYKNLGDLYGPYYPPEYVTSLPKNNPQIRHSLGSGKMGNKGLDLGLDGETPKDMQPTEPQAAESTLDTECALKETMDIECPVVTTDETFAVDAGNMHIFWHETDDFYNDIKVENELASVGRVLNPHELSQPQEQLQSQHPLTEDVQLRPQHRKLTSHPRFKKRHRPGEDLPKPTPSNFKTSLPFQPPPQIHTHDPSEPLAHLSQLPHVPLDPKELWVHEGCIAWTSGVFLVNGRLYGLQEALDGAIDTSCSYCEQVGATLGCYSKGCTLRYHYLCAIEADCSLNEENFSLRCSKHKEKSASHGTYLHQSACKCHMSSLRSVYSERRSEQTCPPGAVGEGLMYKQSETPSLDVDKLEQQTNRRPFIINEQTTFNRQKKREDNKRIRTVKDNSLKTGGV